jgi:EAL domain-containing protein (putative c-di-GMP-specific phosphodiesterase class I)
MITSWYLEGVASEGNMVLIPINKMPFRIGRDAVCELAVSSRELSRIHAQIESNSDDCLRVLDLDSTNGCFVNRQRLEKGGHASIKPGDILHFGTTEFRLMHLPAKHVPPAADEEQSDRTVFFSKETTLPEHFAFQEREFLEMLKRNLITVAFQPIVYFSNRAVAAYEVLGRGAHTSLPQTPIRLLELSTMLGKEVALSQAFRMAGAKAAARMPGKVQLFMNSHPKEMFTEQFYESLQSIVDIAPNMELVIEVHETAVAEVDKMKVMARRLKDMNIMFAYDDFGAGQARLNELAEVPPHVVKFDVSLIRDIDLATPQKQQMMTRLVNIVRDMGSIALAEGVESEGEAAFCLANGFQLCQGFLTGKPQMM